MFDSVYNSYKGIIGYVRVEDGEISKNDRILVMSSGKAAEIVEIGIFAPTPKPVETLYSGQVGYIATGFKDVQECGVGDTLSNYADPATDPLPGYVELKSMVFAGLYPADETANKVKSSLSEDIASLIAFLMSTSDSLSIIHFTILK